MTTDNSCPMTDAAEQAGALRVDVCPECGGGQQYSGVLNFPCRYEWHYREWHDQPAQSEQKSLLREASKPPGKTGVEFVDRLADQWAARQSAALRGDMTGIKNANMWLGIIAKEYWGEIIASLRKTHAPKPAAPVSATPRTDCNWRPWKAQIPGPFLEFTRQLERELAEAKRAQNKLVFAVDQEGCAVGLDGYFKNWRAEVAEARAAELQAKLAAETKNSDGMQIANVDLLRQLTDLQTKLAAETARADGAHNAAIDKCKSILVTAFENNWAEKDTLADISALKVPQ